MYALKNNPKYDVDIYMMKLIMVQWQKSCLLSSLDRVFRSNNNNDNTSRMIMKQKKIHFQSSLLLLFRKELRLMIKIPNKFTCRAEYFDYYIDYGAYKNTLEMAWMFRSNFSRVKKSDLEIWSLQISRFQRNSISQLQFFLFPVMSIGTSNHAESIVDDQERQARSYELEFTENSRFWAHFLLNLPRDILFLNLFYFKARGDIISNDSECENENDDHVKNTLMTRHQQGKRKLYQKKKRTMSLIIIYDVMTSIYSCLNISNGKEYIHV